MHYRWTCPLTARTMLIILLASDGNGMVCIRIFVVVVVAVALQKVVTRHYWTRGVARETGVRVDLRSSITCTWLSTSTRLALCVLSQRV